MKTNIFRKSLLLVGLAIFLSCNKDTSTEVIQPDFINTSLSGTFIDAGEEFDLFIPDNEEGVTYTWTIPDLLEIIKGQGTNKITVMPTINQGVIPLKSIGVTAERTGKKSFTRWFYKELTILAPPPTLENYRTKRYGSKTWMLDNLNETNEDGSLGKVHPDYPEFGRYYTWYEAISGIPNATVENNPYLWGNSGVDDAGNSYVIDGTYTNSANIQIQGVCPEGWHIPNANDWYDLLVAIKEEYNVPGNSIDQIKQIREGYIIPWSREEGLNRSIVTDQWGVIGPYLKGSTIQDEGGYWRGAKSATYGSWGVFPMFVDQSNEIGFNILPNGYWVSSNNTWGDVESYSWHLAAVFRSDEHSRPLRVTVGNTNPNFSNNLLGHGHSVCIRCVANY